jgi:hypothetical protein
MPPRKKKTVEVKHDKPKGDPIDEGTIVPALRALNDHPGWQIIKKILEENIYQQEKKILNTLYNKEIKYSEEDVEKQIRRIYIDIAAMPDREIARLSGNERVEEDYDPYHKK